MSKDLGLVYLGAKYSITTSGVKSTATKRTWHCVIFVGSSRTTPAVNQASEWIIVESIGHRTPRSLVS